MTDKKRYDLVFSKPLNNKNPINLVFGDDDSTGPIVQEHIASAVIDFYEFSLFSNIIVDYGIDPNLVGSSSNIPILKAVIAKNTYFVAFNLSLKLDKPFSSSFKKSEIVKWAHYLNWNSSDKLKDDFMTWWKKSSYVYSMSFKSIFFNSGRNASSSKNSWGTALCLTFSRHPFFYYADSTYRSDNVKFNEADSIRIKFNAQWNIADTFTNKKLIVWNFATLPDGCGPSIRPPVIPPKPPKPDVISIRKDLIFCKPPNNKNPIHLIFGDDCCKEDSSYSIPEKGTYIVQNNVEIFRTDTGQLIKVFSAEIGANSKEYLWSGNLSMPFSELSKIIDKPEIEVNINQYKFVVDINDVSIDQEFNSKMINVAISSTTNQLKSIKAHNPMHDASSIAIMSAQLSRDDLETGFIFVNNGGVDWNIPENLIEYSDASALDIINQIALVTNDSVISHAYKKEIMIKEKYPSSQVSYSLPVGKLFNYSTSDTESVEYNAVVVTGENDGVTAIVRKDGAAGEKIAPMIVNKLITDQAAARRAAINAIYNTSEYAINIDTESIMFKETPMLYPRDLVQIGADIGWIEDISIRAELSDKTAIVRHSMSIEKKVV